jgi:N-acetyl-gamma-glutamyl-phosphate reductase
MIKAAIAGGTGYTAGELLRILLNHKDVTVTAVFSTSSAGKYVYSVHKDLLGDTDLKFTGEIGNPNVIFLCLGHGVSKEFLGKHKLPEKCKIIDLGNDFRLDSDFEGKHFTYGLTDVYLHEIEGSDYIANPGCFATAIQSGLAPIAKAGLLKDEIHVTAITGSTGAGKKLGETSHFSYRDNNISVYKPFTHQHLGEIRKTLRDLSGEEPPQINFVPMRGDFARGIFASIYTKWNCCKNDEQALENARGLFNEFYKDSPFTFVSDDPISMKQVVNTNKVLLHLEIHQGYLHITSAIDNLVKGACGQAVENMNIIFGLDRTEGLKFKPSAF